MEKGFNLTVAEFKEGLVQYINNSNIPIIVKNQILNEITLEVNNLTKLAIEKEQQDFDKQKEIEENKE